MKAVTELDYPSILTVRTIACAICEGTGELPEDLPNNCLACGEPIAESEEWCSYHAGAKMSQEFKQ